MGTRLKQEQLSGPVLTFFCGFCGEYFEAPLVEGLCPTCEQSAEAVSASPEGRQQIEQTLDSLASEVVRRRPEVEGAVVITPTEIPITAEVLDLAVLFYSHLVITERDMGARVFDLLDARARHRIEAYTDAGLITVLVQLDAFEGPTGEETSWPSVNLRQCWNDSQADRPYWLEQLTRRYTELLANDVLRSGSRLAELMRWGRTGACPEIDAGWSTSQAAGWTVAFARRDLPARLVGGSMVGDPRYTGFRTALAPSLLPSVGIEDQGLISCLPWYGNAVHRVPKLDRPEALIEWREDLTRWDFVNAVTQQLQRAEPGTDSREVAEKMQDCLDRQVRRARLLASSRSETIGVGLSGLMATVGGLVGGVPGAVAGGLGAAAAQQISSVVLERRTAPWASYFLDPLDG